MNFVCIISKIIVSRSPGSILRTLPPLPLARRPHPPHSTHSRGHSPKCSLRAIIVLELRGSGPWLK